MWCSNCNIKEKVTVINSKIICILICKCFDLTILGDIWRDHRSTVNVTAEYAGWSGSVVLVAQTLQVVCKPEDNGVTSLKYWKKDVNP